jgi:hypothetical protein
MNYASATRGRWVVVIGAIVLVGSCWLPWWQVGGGPGELPAQGAIGFDAQTGPVVLMFVAAILTLMLATLPFASEKPLPIEHPVSYLTLFGVALVSFVWTVYLLQAANLFPWPPMRGLGPWVSIVGLVLMVRGVFELFEERRSRLY